MLINPEERTAQDLAHVARHIVHLRRRAAWCTTRSSQPRQEDLSLVIQAIPYTGWTKSGSRNKLLSSGIAATVAPEKATKLFPQLVARATQHIAQSCSELGTFIRFPNPSLCPSTEFSLQEHPLGKQAMPEDVLIAEISPQRGVVEGVEEFPWETGEQQCARPPSAAKGPSLRCPVYSGYALLSLKLIPMEFWLSTLKSYSLK